MFRNRIYCLIERHLDMVRPSFWFRLEYIGWIICNLLIFSLGQMLNLSYNLVYDQMCANANAFPISHICA